MGRHSEKAAIHKPGRGVSPEPNHADGLILGLQSPELWIINACGYNYHAVYGICYSSPGFLRQWVFYFNTHYFSLLPTLNFSFNSDTEILRKQKIKKYGDANRNPLHLWDTTTIDLTWVGLVTGGWLLVGHVNRCRLVELSYIAFNSEAVEKC